MSRYELVGTADSVKSITEVLNVRRKQLGLSLAEMNDLTGLAGGYCNKIFAPGYLKNLGPVSMPVFLQTLGCRLAIIADDESLPPVTRRAITEKSLSPSRVQSRGDRAKRLRG